MLLAVLFVVRYTRPVTLVLVGLLLAIPVAGFATFALSSDPPPELTLWILVAYVPALIALGTGIWMLRHPARSQPALTAPTIALFANGILVIWAGYVLVISEVVYLFEPALGIANIVLNAIWFAVWIPPRWRQVKVEGSTEISASPSRVYDFIVVPANWSQYQEGVESVTVQPAGPLAVGSVVTERRHISHSGLRGPQIYPDSVEVELTITKLIPDQLIAAAALGREANQATVELRSVDSRTRIITRAVGLVPYRYAVLGLLLAFRTNRHERVAAAGRSVERLKKLLEEATPAE